MNEPLTHGQVIEKVNAFIEKYQSDLSYAHGTDHVQRVARLGVKIRFFYSSFLRKLL